MPLPGETPDAFLRLVLPLLAWITAAGGRLGVPAPLPALAAALAWLALYAAVVALVVRVRRYAASPGVAGLLAAVAGGLAAWIVLHPGTGSEFAFVRGDHLIAAGCGGAAIRRLSPALRLRILVAVSAGAIVLVAGLLPAALVCAGMACGFVAQRLDPAAPPARAAFVQGAIMLATEAACYLLWFRHTGFGLAAQGLFVFMVLRHVSWVVDVRRGAEGTLVDYCCFQLFYPCCYGATERFADFRFRNADPGAVSDDATLLRAAVRGAVYFVAWLAFPASVGPAALFAAPDAAAFAALYLLFFVRSALYLMGAWSTLEAVALCWGMRIHPNFRRVLAGRTPSQFWFAWRGTMTLWLVEYVYLPLGGVRTNRTRNIFVVFAVSGLWHAASIPFLQPLRSGAALLPIVAWAVLSASVMALSLEWRVRGWRLWPAGTPVLLRTNAGRLGTWVFGGLGTALFAIQGDLVESIPAFVARLVGLP